MLENNSGTIMVYASNAILRSRRKRVQSVSLAAKKMAEVLKMKFEVVAFGHEFLPIYVYYRNGDEEPIPVYWDKGGKLKMTDVYSALRSMMFVLSFHPKLLGLRGTRNALIRFS